jgi:hypothetical protein
MAQLKDWQSGTSNDPYVVGSSGSLTLNQGTANGVAYLNGSKVVTSGSALVFDGTSLKNVASSSGASPSANGNLLVLESSGNAGLTIASGASSVGNIFFADSGDNADGFIQYNQSSRGFVFGTAANTKMTLDSSGNLGLGVTPSAWNTDYKNFAVGTGGEFYGRVSTTETGFGSNYYRNSGGSYIYLTSAAASYQAQVGGVHYWFNAPSGTAGNAITFTQAATLTAAGNYVVGSTSSDFRLASIVESGANRDMFMAAVNGVTNGFTVKWNHSTSKIRVNIQNIPTSASGLSTGDLWNDGGTLKIA